MPAVSVLMPTFEQAAFLPRAVASLHRQSLADWELVIVDDGSQDDTAAAVAPFLTDRRIALHRLPRNRGLGAALNRGLLHYDAGRYDDALADLRRALTDGADPVTAHYNLALVQLARGAWADARDSVNQALRLAPDHRDALQLRERIVALAPR